MHNTHVAIVVDRRAQPGTTLTVNGALTLLHELVAAMQGAAPKPDPTRVQLEEAGDA